MNEKLSFVFNTATRQVEAIVEGVNDEETLQRERNQGAGAGSQGAVQRIVEGGGVGNDEATKLLEGGYSGAVSMAEAERILAGGSTSLEEAALILNDRILPGVGVRRFHESLREVREIVERAELRTFESAPAKTSRGGISDAEAAALLGGGSGPTTGKVTDEAVIELFN